MADYTITRETNEFSEGLSLFDDIQPDVEFLGNRTISEGRLKDFIANNSTEIIRYKFDGESNFTTTSYDELSKLSLKGHKKISIYLNYQKGLVLIGKVEITIIDDYFGTLQLDLSKAKTTYIWTDESGEISNDGVTASLLGKQIPSDSLRWNLSDVNIGIKYKETAIYEIKCTYTATFQFTGSHGDQTVARTYESSYKVTGKPQSISSVTKIGTDPNVYYDSDFISFSKPSGVRFRVTYSDGRYIDYQANDTSHVNFYLDSACTKSAVGVRLKHDENSNLYVKVETNDFMGNSEVVVYPIAFKETIPTTISVKGSFILTNKPSNEKEKISVSVTYNSGYKDDPLPYTGGTNGWRFEAQDTRYMDTSKPLRIIINRFGHDSEPFEIKPTFANPTPKTQGTVIYGKKLSTSLVNGSSIDFTDTYLRSEFTDSDYYEDLSYDGISAGAGYYSASSSDLGESFKFDGSQNVMLEVGEDLSKEISVSLSGQDSLGNAVSKTLPLVLYEVTDIIGLSCISPKTEYKVGEAFLNENDSTKVKVWYKKEDGTKKSIEMDLKSSFGSLSVYPAKGTEFSYSGKQTVRVQSIFDTTKYFTYDITIVPSVRYASETKTLNFRFMKLPGDITYKTENGSVNLKIGTYIKVLQDDVEASGDGNSWKLKSDLSLATGYDSLKGVKIYGYLDNVGDKDHNGVLVDFNDYVPPIDGSSNATIKFPCYDKDASSFVDGCTFGVRFGHNNSLNRLFISGNPDKPNYDIHSVEPNLTNEDEASSVLQGDFSYFPDEAMCKYGESENAIVGYDVVSDTKLLVLKNRSAKEKTIYFRVPTMVTMLDSSGSIMTDLSGGTLYQEEYSVYMSNSSVAGISPESIANFNGDTVFVDDECEVAGLDIEGIVGDSQRQANSRSKYIDRKLKEYDLSKATLTVFKMYLILDIPGVASFITERSSISGSQYEWWRCDSLNAVCFMEMDGELYYATDDGAICKLSEDSYSDKDRYFIDVALSGDTYKNDVLVSDEYTEIMKDGADYTWLSKPFKNDYEGYLYAKIMDVREGDEAYVDLTDNTIKVSSEHMYLKDYLGSANIYYINSYYGNAYSSEYGKPYRLMNVKTEDGLDVLGTFKLLDEDFNEVDLTKFKDGFEIVKRLQGEVDAKPNGEGTIKLYDDLGKPYDLVRYAGQDPSVSISGVLTRVRPIKTRLVSAPLLISTANWFKHVIKLDISQGTNDKSDLMVAYCNNKIPYIVEDAVKDRGQTIDLGSFSFSNVDFSSNFYTRTYTIGKELKCIKYICVAFASDRDMNSVIPSISMTYTVSTLSKGIAD